MCDMTLHARYARVRGAEDETTIRAVIEATGR
jgi:hypothetical protein